MLKTQLSLEPSCSTNPKILRLFDTSHYCKDEAVDNYLVEVLPANGTKWITFPVAKGFSLALNSSNLRYSVTSTEDGLLDLPDGIYEVRVSIKPNTITARQFYHLRTTVLRKRLHAERAKLVQAECKLSHEEFYRHLAILRDIEDYLDAAVYTVEEQTAKKQGLDLYDWADKRLKDYSNECKC